MGRWPFPRGASAFPPWGVRRCSTGHFPLPCVSSPTFTKFTPKFTASNPDEKGKSECSVCGEVRNKNFLYKILSQIDAMAKSSSWGLLTFGQAQAVPLKSQRDDRPQAGAQPPVMLHRKRKLTTVLLPYPGGGYTPICVLSHFWRLFRGLQ